MSLFRLKLNSLKFISPVDTPAQETATAVLLKRAGLAVPAAQKAFGDCHRAKVVKTNDELGLVFGWALTTKKAGVDYFDLHGDNIVEDDLIKVALEWMEAGGATDEMHNRKKDGWAPFCMPMTATVAKAFGIPTDTHGIMIAMKPSAEVFAKFKSGELTGFSIDGTGFRTELMEKTLGKSVATFDQVAAAATVKASLVTDEVDGHAHTVEICDDGSMYTSWATAEGAENGHSHAVVMGEGGAIQILADSGHSHKIAEGSPNVVFVAPEAIVVVQASAPRTAAKGNSTTAKPASSVGTMKTDAEKIADLEKQLTELTKRNDLIRRLGPTEHAVWKSLDGDESLAFLLASINDRAPIVKRFDDSNAVVYKAADGTEYRMRDDQRMVALAKRADDETQKRVDLEVAKRAESISNLGGDKSAHVDLIKAVERETDGTKREAMMKALTGAASIVKSLGSMQGSTDSGDPETAESVTKALELKKAVEEFQKANGIAHYAVAFTKGLESDPKIRRLYEESK